MGDVIPFKKPKLSEKFKNRSLCNSGFHLWKIDSKSSFDVKKGKLVTIYRCERCGARKSELR